MKNMRMFILACILVGLSTSLSFAKERVIKRTDAVITDVIDGDTVKVKTRNGNVNVRLLYIDTMEKSDNTKMRNDIKKLEKEGVRVRKKDMIALGKIAKIYLRSILRDGDAVVLETVQGREKDRYGRTLAVILKKGSNINLAMVQNGYARTYFVGSVDEKTKKTYLEAESGAKKGRLVIWNYIAPRD